MDVYRKDFDEGTDVDLVSFVLPYLEQRFDSEDLLLQSVEDKTIQVVFDEI